MKALVRPPSGQAVKGIGGREASIGTALIQTPFKDIKLVLDVDLILLSDDIPTLLWMRNMVKLDMSIQKAHIIHGEIQQKQKFDNYFFIQFWDPDDILFALYTEK